MWRWNAQCVDIMRNDVILAILHGDALVWGQNLIVKSPLDLEFCLRTGASMCNITNVMMSLPCDVNMSHFGVGFPLLVNWLAVRRSPTGEWPL